VTNGGRTFFAPCHSHSGPLLRCVGGFSPNKTELRVNDTDGGDKSSSSSLSSSSDANNNNLGGG
jgi:hypothetical protein